MKKIVLVFFSIIFSILSAQERGQEKFITINPEGNGRLFHVIEDCPIVLEHMLDFNPKVVDKYEDILWECRYCVRGKKYKFSRTYIGLCESALSISDKKGNMTDLSWTSRDTTIQIGNLDAMVEISHEKLTSARMQEIDKAHTAVTLSLIGAGLSAASGLYNLYNKNYSGAAASSFLTEEMVYMSYAASRRSRTAESLDIFCTILNNNEEELQISDLDEGKVWYLRPGEFRCFYAFDVYTGRYRIQSMKEDNAYYLNVNAHNKLYKFKPAYWDKNRIVMRIPEVNSIDHYVRLKNEFDGMPVSIDADSYVVSPISEAEYDRLSEINNEALGF